MTTARTIIVAGAGIGGLTAALALARRGFRVVICEKAARLEEAGAGLQVSPNASRVLIDLGLRPRLTPHATAPGAVAIMSARGGEIVRLPLGDAASPDAGAPYWVIRRADLQAALLAAVNDHPDIELRLGCAVAGFDDGADGVSVFDRRGADRASEPAEALVGADGVWSAVRRQLHPDLRPRFSGLIAWRGTLDTSALPRPPAIAGLQLWMGPNAHLVAYPIANGRQVNLVAVLPGSTCPDGWSAPGAAAEIEAEVAAWPDAARALIDAVRHWTRWGLFTMPDGGVWGRGRVALLGDASHAMLPFAAQGAGMAIEDAAVLAKCLGGPGGDVAAALARYAGLRGPRIGRVQRAARRSGQIYHLRGPLALARDLVIRALGTRRLQARQDWIYDWRA